jgi:2-polyprenyl-3-methyl-5-hydroxy-6-metoxy-1,4-benzoquinol methylase
MTNVERHGAAGGDAYTLGHADVEINRLLLQGRLYNDHTEHALRMAGLRPGMRVLDVGCGPGEVSFVGARLVGPSGSVLGIDAASQAIEVARSRAAQQRLSAVKFEQTALADIEIDQVDAVIGRLILMHLPDPVSVLRQLAALVRPGGVIAFCEFDIAGSRSLPDSRLSRTVVQGIVDAFKALGLDPAFGTTLRTLFRRAGLHSPRLTLAAPIGGADDIDVLAYVVEVWRLLHPIAAQLGPVADDLADLDTLLPRLREEVAAGDAIVMLPPMITAWTQVGLR